MTNKIHKTDKAGKILKIFGILLLTVGVIGVVFNMMIEDYPSEYGTMITVAFILSLLSSCTGGLLLRTSEHLK